MQQAREQGTVEQSTLLECIRGLSEAARRNFRRVFIAALAAEKLQGTVVVVEGLRKNSIRTQEKDGELKRNVTGSHMAMLAAKILKTIGAIPNDLPFIHTQESRNTDWEADAMLRHVANPGRIIGIAGPFHEPSEGRADAILQKLAPSGIATEAHAPISAKQIFQIEFSPLQQAIWDATETSSTSDLIRGIDEEDSAAHIQRISDGFARLGLRGRNSLISWIAFFLRRNKPYRSRPSK